MPGTRATGASRPLREGRSGRSQFGFTDLNPPRRDDRRPYGSLYDGRYSRHRPDGIRPPRHFRPHHSRQHDGHYYRGYYPGSHYRHYRDYGRCYRYGYGYGHGYGYGYASAYYRPYYYPDRYDDYYYGSVSLYTTPYYPRAYDTVIYADTVVTEPPVVGETYYTTPTTTILEPTTTLVPEGTVVIEPEMGVEEPTTTVIEPQTRGVEPGTSREPAGVVTPKEDVPESEAPALVEKGNAAFATGNYKEARRLYARAMLVDVTDGYAKLFYGLAHFATGYYDVAADAFRRALYDAPELIHDPIDLRMFYSDHQAVKAQMAYLVTAVNEQPENTELVFLLGYLYFSTGEPQLAVTTLQPVTGEDSADPLATLVRDAAIRVLPGEDTGSAAPNAPRDQEVATE